MKKTHLQIWKKIALVSRKIFVPLSIFLLFCIGGYVFFVVNTKVAYIAHRTIEFDIVNHPEFIPTAKNIRATSAGFESIIGDFYWLDTVQYIGSNAIEAAYKKYLYELVMLITDISPHFTYPYQIAILLLPDINERYEHLSKAEGRANIESTLKLGEKATRTICDAGKVDTISKEFDLNTLFSDSRLKNPCEDALVPYYLAYVYYWNAHDPESASKWYKVAAMHDSAPRGARIMSAIMQGKTGNREKAIIMFLSLAESMNSEKWNTCQKLTGSLRSLLIPAFWNGEKLNKNFLQAVEKARISATESLWEKQEEIEKTDISSYCSSYLNKAVREMNLAYIQEGDDRYFNEKKVHARNAKVLFDAHYIDYLPRDYQKGSDGYEIIYIYNNDISAWDFEMGKY